jgi:hypothetical protein
LLRQPPFSNTLRALQPEFKHCAQVKQKNTTLLCRVFLLYNPGTLGGRLAHRLDALGAEHFMHNASLFHHDRFLQVGLEGTIGGALGE